MPKANNDTNPSTTFKKSDADYMAIKAIVDRILSATPDRRKRKKIMGEMGDEAWSQVLDTERTAADQREAACVLAAVTAWF